MGLDSVLKKLEATLKKKLVTPLESTATALTDTSQSGLIRQWVSDKLAALTPSRVPSVLFQPAKGFVSHTIAFDDHWRFFSVDIANFGAVDGRQSGKTPYEIDITIEVGYPGFPFVTVAGESFEVPKLKSADDEQIDSLLRGAAFFSGFVGTSGAADGAVIHTLGGAYDIGSTMRRHRYVARGVRSW
jgi:hypothetical protein